MNFKKNLREARAAAGGEKGFTLIEILVTLAVIALLIVITATFMGERATDTRHEAIASQVAQTIAAQQQLYVSGLRDARMNSAVVAGRVRNGLVAMDEFTAVAANATACTTAAAGLVITIDGDNGEGVINAANLQALLHAAVNDLFVNPADGGAYGDVFAAHASHTPTANAPIPVITVSSTVREPVGGASPTDGIVNLCLGTAG